MGTRVALVIANSNYAAVAKLPNPPRDAEAIADVLRADGFSDVKLVSDVSRQELIRYFEGLELLESGLVSVSLWRPDPSDLGVPVEVYEFCGAGRKPDLNSALFESAVQEPGCLGGGFGLDTQPVHEHQVVQ